MIIRNGLTLYHNRLGAGQDIQIADRKILAIQHGLTSRAGEKVLDVNGAFVLPGFIDLHTHGLKDVYLLEGSWREYSRLQVEQGVTGCLPTLFTTPKELIDVLQDALATTDKFRQTPNLLGFRLEMPYLKKPGAGPESMLTAINTDLSEQIFAAARGKIRVWDVSPDLDGAIDFIRWANLQGVIVSLAHSSATIEQAKLAVDAGLKLVTHFFDTFDLPVQTDAGVYPAGLVDYLLVEDRVSVEIIPDGVHVHPLLLEKTLRCKTPERMVFITDSVKGAGSPPGIYSGLYKGIEVEVTADRGVRRLSDGALSGSALTMLGAFRNAVLRFGCSIPQASALCSRTAANLLGLQSKGYLAPGMDADLIVLDENFNLKVTILGGEIVYRAE